MVYLKGYSVVAGLVPATSPWYDNSCSIRTCARAYLQELSKSTLPSLISFSISSPNSVVCQANQGRE